MVFETLNWDQREPFVKSRLPSSHLEDNMFLEDVLDTRYHVFGLALC